MCGIAGFLDFDRQRCADPLRLLDSMRDTLTHRGPDAGGSALEAEGRIGLGHRRLAIIDLSQTGAQPMESASGRHVIVFNGEIYNFQSIRNELTALGVDFRGTSDTEVLLEAVEHFGLAGALGRANGMFALAIYDRKTRQLAFARDRLGKKPLYIGISGSTLAFGSAAIRNSAICKSIHAPQRNICGWVMCRRHCRFTAMSESYRLRAISFSRSMGRRLIRRQFTKKQSGTGACTTRHEKGRKLGSEMSPRL